MTTKQYLKAITQRGGKAAVAHQLGVTVSTLNRRLSGEHKIVPEMTLALAAIPVRPEWGELAKLVKDRNYRNHYKVWTLALPHGEERERRIRLLSEAAKHVTGKKTPLNGGGGDGAPAR